MCRERSRFAVGFRHSPAGRLPQPRVLLRSRVDVKALSDISAAALCSQNMRLRDALASRVSGSAGATPAAGSRWRCFYGLPAARPGASRGIAEPGTRGHPAHGNSFSSGQNPVRGLCPRAPRACAHGSLLSLQARECEPSQTCGHSRPAGAKVIAWDLC